MTTILATRNNHSGRHIARFLSQKNQIDAILWESGAKAKRRKIKNSIYPPREISKILASLILSRYLSYGQSNFLPEISISSKKIPQKFVEDINDDESLSFLNSYNPERLVIMGTSILSPKTLAIPKETCLNIHTGIIPPYRNVQSEAWAILFKDFCKIGVTILHMDTGIDTGNIVKKSTLPPEFCYSKPLTKIKSENIILAGSLISETLEYGPEALPSHPQKKEDSRFFLSLGLRQVSRLLARDFRIYLDNKV